MKRVYKTVTTEPAETGFAVHLDQRRLRTPAGKPLILPTEALAAAIAGEWDAQAVEVKPHTMPLMQLAATTTDLVASGREAIVDAVAAYAGTDLVCYRADRPQSLVARQKTTWDPLIDWVLKRYDSPLLIHTGIMPRPQPDATLAALRRVVAACDDWTLAALQTATAAAGSLVIALALFDGELDADQAFVAAELDGTFQIEQWGEDAEATARRTRLAGDLRAAARFVQLLAHRTDRAGQTDGAGIA